MSEYISAYNGGFAAGRDINISGISPEHLKEIIRDILNEKNLSIQNAEKLQKRVVELSNIIAVQESTLKTFLRIIGEHETPLNMLSVKLFEIANRHNMMLQQLASLSSEDKNAQLKMRDAYIAIENGDYNRADNLLEQIHAIVSAGLRMAEELQMQAQLAANKRRLEAANTLYIRGELCITCMNYSQASVYFKDASEIVPQTSLEKKYHYLEHYLKAKIKYCKDIGGINGLKEIIQNCRKNIRVIPHKEMPLEWASIHNELGSALLELSILESSQSHIKEALKHFMFALEERSIEREPLQWVTTQRKLATALAIIGQRENGTQHLEDAVNVYRTIIKLHKFDNLFDFIDVHLSLIRALRVIGERIGNVQCLQESIGLCYETLNMFTRDQHRLKWGDIQAELGETMWVLGMYSSDEKLFNSGIIACCEALKEITVDRLPLDHAFTQASLGMNLTHLGERNSDALLLQQAINTFQTAIKIYNRTPSIANKAYCQFKIGKALKIYGEIKNDQNAFNDALNYCNQALKIFTREEFPLFWAETQSIYGSVLHSLGIQNSDTLLIRQAINCFYSALEELNKTQPILWGETEYNLGMALETIGYSLNNHELIINAKKAYAQALVAFQDITNAPYYASKTNKRLDRFN